MDSRSPLTPASVSLAAGATQQFTATTRMSDGSGVAVQAKFTATGGSVKVMPRGSRQLQPSHQGAGTGSRTRAVKPPAARFSRVTVPP